LRTSLVKFMWVARILFSMSSSSVSTGYLLAVGIASFATCYQHGPLTTELSITLFTWTLQITAFVLIYCGVTIPQVAYAVIAGSLCSKGLWYPLGAACRLGRFVWACERPAPCIARRHWRLRTKKPLGFNKVLRISRTSSYFYQIESCSRKRFKCLRHRNLRIFHLAVLSTSFVLWRTEKCDCS